MKRFVWLIFLSACSSYKPCLPETEIPTEWKEIVPAVEFCTQKNRFWELFNDPLLNELEEEAICANFDLQIAAARIEQARALVQKEHAKRLPEVFFNGSAVADETLINPRFFGSPRKLERTAQRQYNFLADFAYELDLWGKFRAEEKSARYRRNAVEWEYEFVYQNIVIDVATRYMTIRTLEEQIRYLRQAVGSRNDAVKIYTSRAEAGCDAEIDLSRSKLDSPSLK